MNKTFLVTGAAGFIGSHLSSALLGKGFKVIGLDNLLTGSMENIAKIIDDPGFTFVEQEIEIPLFLKIDGIFNLACPASPVQYQKDPVKTVRTNVLGAINVLELATKLGVSVFQASTSEVYGDPNISPQNEKYWGNVNPIGPRSCYDEGKRVAETLFFDYHRQYGTNIKVARIFNTYGPNMAIEDGRVISNFIVQALRNDDITVYGDGFQTRSFCFITDLIEALLNFYFGIAEYSSPLNIGNPNEFSMLDLANQIIKLTNSKSQIKYLPLPEDDPQQRRPDISEAKSLLGWTPKVQLSDGLENTIHYFKKKLMSAT